MTIATSSTMESELTLRLSDGRQLSYAEYGDRAGAPLFYNHSGTRLDLRAASQMAAAAGVRIIALDRPGIGLSDFRPGYQILDWPDDVAEAADQLEVDHFATLGHSVGTIYSLACAYKLPGRLTRCGLVGAAAPLDTPGITKDMPRGYRMLVSLAQRTSWAMRIQTRLLTTLSASVSDDRIVQSAVKTFSEPDRNAYREWPELMDDFVLTPSREVFRQGTKGAAWSGTLMVRPWGFLPEQIQVPVYIWQGQQDTNTPVAMAEYLAQLIPDCHLRIMANEGHYSVLVKHMQEILTTLSAP